MGDGVLRFALDVTRLKTTDIQRREGNGFCQRVTAAFRPGQAEFLLELRVNVRHLRERLLFLNVQRTNIVVIMGNRDLRICGAHARQQIDQQCGRVRRPVAIVAVVQHARRTINRHFKVGNAAGAEVNLHAPRLVDGAVAQQPYVAFQQLRVLEHDGLQMRRAGFLLAFKKHFQVDCGRYLGRTQSVESVE